MSLEIDHPQAKPPRRRKGGVDGRTLAGRRIKQLVATYTEALGHRAATPERHQGS